MDRNQSKAIDSSMGIGVEGETSILITDPNCKKMSKHKSSMPYYIGEVRSGGRIINLKGIKATILCFEDAEAAKNIHDCLRSVSHMHVMKSLGYGSGLKRFSRYLFLALPFFECTFEEYIKEHWKCVEMGRFTMDIIMITGGIVRAMLALHRAGFCCKKLRPRDIAIVKHPNFICAKIWNFEKCISDDDREQDWVRLGKLLQLTNHWSKEAEDLYDNLLNGKLKGLDILKHSALLTVRKKFRNVLIFYFYLVAHWTDEETQDSPVTTDPPEISETVTLDPPESSNPPDTSKIVPSDLSQSSVTSDPPESSNPLDTSEIVPSDPSQSSNAPDTSEIVQAPSWLDEHLDWKSQRKSWMFARSLTDPPNTYRGFSINIRHLTEHEVDFLPPEMVEKISFKDRESGKEEIDLERHIRRCWDEAFLKVQNFVRTENLTY